MESAGNAAAGTEGLATTVLFTTTQALSTSTSATCVVNNDAVVTTASETPIYTWYPWLDISVDCLDQYNGGAWRCDAFAEIRNSGGADGGAYATVRNNGTIISIDTSNDGIFDLTEQDLAGMPIPTCLNNYCDGAYDWDPVSDWLINYFQAKYTVPVTSVRKFWSNDDGLGMCDGACDPAGRECCWNSLPDNWDEGNYGFYRALIEKKGTPQCSSDFTYIATNDLCYKDEVADSSSSTCTQLEAEAKCTLLSEFVDGVATVSYGLSTGLVPLPSSKTLTGMLDSYTVWHDWWRKERSYSCTTDTRDFSDAETRFNNIQTTTTTAGTEFLYQDMQKDENGNWILSDHSSDLPTDLPSASSGDSCQKACKLSSPSTDTRVTSEGTVNESQVSSSSTVYRYAECLTETCPSKSGETIVKDCQCINEFAESVAILESLTSAAKDVICSALSE
jgi:hypothetical protein